MNNTKNKEQSDHHGKHSSGSLRKETVKHTVRCLIGCNIGEGIGAAVGFQLVWDMTTTSRSGSWASLCSRLRLYHDSYAQNDVIKASSKGNCNWRHCKHRGDGICRNFTSIIDTRLYGSCIDRRNILDRIWHNTASRLSCSISYHVLGHEARIAK
jgi:hypothetical protein